MKSGAPPSLEPPAIGIIAKNDRTVTELLHYFAQVGASAKRLPELARWKSHPEESAGLQAFVIFPDDFEASLITETLTWIAEQAPRLLQLVVTRQPQRFLPTTIGPAPPPHRFVLPRPSFGWLILDAIRAHQLRPFDAEP
jgi:hypothetical protein